MWLYKKKSKKKKRSDTQIKFYKVAALPLLLYGRETWVTTEQEEIA